MSSAVRRSSIGPPSGRKRRLSTHRTIDQDNMPTQTGDNKSTKRTATKSSDDGFEFTTKKQKKTAGSTASSSASSTSSASASPSLSSSSSSAASSSTPSASASSSSSSSSSTSSSSSSAPSKSSSTTPAISAPSYPSGSLRKPEKFTFRSDKSLPDGITQLCADVFEREQTFVEATFGAKSKHKSASKGQLAFIPTICALMAQEVLRNMPGKLNDHMKQQPDDGKPTILENPVNVANRELIEKYTRLTKQVEADRAVFIAEHERRMNQAPKEKVVGELSEEDANFLASTKGGTLAQSIASAYLTRNIKGDATLNKLRRMKTYVDGVEKDQRTIATRIIEEEKKAYGAAVDDPKALISMITGQ